MKKTYDTMDLVVIFFTEEVVRTSQSDNVGDMRESGFPEFLG